MKLSVMFREFANTFEELHYLVGGLCVGFVCGWIAFAFWYIPPEMSLSIEFDITNLEGVSMPELDELGTTSTITTTLPLTTTTQTILICGRWEKIGSDGLCHPYVIGNTTPSGLGGCGGWAL